MERLQKAFRALLTPTLMFLRPLLLRKKWFVIDAVNAGTQADVTAYQRFAFVRKLMARPAFHPIGFIRIKGKGLSLVVGTPHSNKALRRDRALLEACLDDLKSYKANRISLNGTIPSSVQKHNIDLTGTNMVTEQLGTMFMIVQNVEQVFEHHQLSKDEPIAVVGCGYTGLRICKVLADKGYRVHGFDRVVNNATLKGVDFKGSNFESIGACKVIVLFTDSGDSGMRCILNHIRCETIIVSDTHPKPSFAYWKHALDMGCYCYESASVLDGAFFIPALPGWKSDTIPGCVVQSIVEAFSDEEFDHYEAFERAAINVGIKGRLDQVHDTPDPYLKGLARGRLKSKYV